MGQWEGEMHGAVEEEGRDEWGSGRERCTGQWRRKEEMSGTVEEEGRGEWGSGRDR